MTKSNHPASVSAKGSCSATNEPNDRLRRALSGDEEALNQLFRGHMAELHRVALRVLGTREDAEDALQDGLLAAWHNLKTFEGRSQFSTWLTRIIVNSSLMRLRRRRAHIIVSIDEEAPGSTDMSFAGKVVDPRPTPEETCAQVERWRIFRRTLQDLPVVYRTAVWLCDVEGMGAKQAAQVLRIPLGTVKSQVTRGRRMISQRVQESDSSGE
jgi:RNA polymerase sigma-70 factor (ECF subfamily)